MTKSIINIGLACGGTGGHISPALALASSFKNHNIKPVFITDVRGSSLLKSMSHYVVLSGSPSAKGFTKVINMLKIFFGILQSTYYLYRTRVNLVIGFGGYTSVPIILAAKILNIPSIIHEQNKILGRANKNDSAEVLIDDEFIGVVFEDDEDGEICFQFNMTILSEDLED